jgi:hypothetical protein
VSYTSLERDLAVVVFTLGNPTVRQHYLLTLLQSYCFVLTSTLEALGVKWQRLGISFNELATRFFEQIPYAVLSSILVSMQGITEDQIFNLHNTPDGAEEKPKNIWKTEDDENHNSTHSEQFDNKTEAVDVDAGEDNKLSCKRVLFLLHLLDDVKKFI